MRKTAVIGAAIAVAGIVMAIVLVAPQWPFEQGRFKQRLEAATGSSAQIGSYREVFFPHPGCVAEQVVLTPKDDGRPSIRVERLGVKGLYWGLMGKVKHLHSLDVQGLQVKFPARHDSRKTDGQESGGSSFTDIRFDEINTKDATLAFGTSDDSSQARAFHIYQLRLKDFAPGRPMDFSATLHIPEPPAEVAISGKFGPFQAQIGKTALAGSFTLKDADLSKYDGIGGKLASQGKFNGVLEALQVQGKTDTPDFTVTSSGHTLHLQTEYTTLVNGMKGDVEFDSVKAQLAETKLVARGKLASQPAGSSKLLDLEVSSDDARIQDLLYLFVSTKPPMQGTTRFQAKVRLPFNGRPFAKRVGMTAHFGIRGSHFTDPGTQQKVGELSESARGNPKDDDPPTILTDLSGDAVLANGKANFSQLSFSAPGVGANMHGSYNLENERVDLHGTMRTDVKLSQATTGFKAFLMKVVEAAKKQKKEGATVPVSITGTYDKPSFGIDAPAEKQGR